MSAPNNQSPSPARREGRDGRRQEPRQYIDRLIATGDAAAAARALSDLWNHENTGSVAAFAVSRFEQLRPSLALHPYRLAILRSFTVEPLVPLLHAAAFCAGIDLQIHVDEFNAYVQAIVDPASPLYRFSPDAVVLAVQTRDAAPDLWNNFAALSSDQVAAAITSVTAAYRDWIRTFRKTSPAHLIVHNLELSVASSRGVLDAQPGVSQTNAIARINENLRGIASEHANVYVLDYDGLIARQGRDHWHDERKWLTVRLPMATQSMMLLVRQWMKFLHPLTGKIAKALVVDLDNTLWGGVIGEDGMAGIRLGVEYPGAAFQQLQRALLDLYQRGILLAICSKNNEEDALEVLQKHDGMILKPSHFSAMRINWSDKPGNLGDIAKELNIGLDALAFLDDNAAERQQVRDSLPDVHVLDFPQDPLECARALRDYPLFERLALSAEDMQRGSMYQAQQERARLEQSQSSREDFYRSLQQEAEISPLTQATQARIAQLTNKTNQFNLTTRRYSEQQLAELAASPGWNCFSIRVRDRFGDNGLTGVAITRLHDGICEIDTLLMSCRVIGRTLETAFLSFLVQFARSHGAQQLQGWFLPTRKNAPARNFYPSHGFATAGNDGDATLWTLDLANPSVTCPEWVKLSILEGEK